MVLNPLRIFLFLAGLGAAALGVAYVSGALDPLLFGAPAQVASVPDQPAGEADAKGGRLPAADKLAPDTPASGKPAEEVAKPAEPAAEKGDRLVPTFDVVRVEPDGSVVIAGRSAPKARIEVLSVGENVVAAGAADAGGDFAIVFDNPLKPGDYQFTLRATPPAGEVLGSAQTAIVSIPEKADGQVLAMVEEPGKPAQVITAPQPAAEPKPTEGGANAMKPAAPAGDAPPAMIAEPKAAEPKAEPSGEPAEMAATEPSQPADAAGKPGQGAMASAEPKPAESDAGESGPAEAAKSAEAPAAQGSDTTSAEPPKPAGSAPAAAASRVSVQAVEIEGRQIFVAGSAEPGRTVRVYANEEVLGEAKAAPNGRFLVEAQKDLAVGNYIIRADMLGDDGAQVIARAAVPFEREPGESIAAVAPSEPAQADGTQTAPAAEKPSEMAAAEPKAPAPDAGPAAGGAEPTKPTEAASGEAPAKPAAPALIGENQLPRLDNGIASSPPEVLSAKLEPTNDAVIIRRGDSLWRISRRVYGRGIRYSTIYMANQSQIKDPDMIWPGQIFAVPEKTEEGESADMSKIGDQATTAQ